MLYISRIKSGGRSSAAERTFEVRDTDDGTAESVNWRHLREYTAQGIQIAGVESTLLPSGVRRLDRVTPYQFPDTIKPWQTKLGVVYGVDIRMCDSYIVYIGWSNSQLPSGGSLRLVDFGGKLGSNAFAWNEMESKFLCIVLDDRMVVQRDAFFEAFRRRVQFDIRGVRSSSIATAVYREAQKYYQYHGANSIKNRIIDVVNRADFVRDRALIEDVRRYL